MQGIWENIMNSDTEKAFTLIKGRESFNFVFSIDQKKLNFPIGESIEGFQNDDSGNKDSLNVKILRDSGLYYTILDRNYINKDGWIHRPDYLTPEYFECDGQNMSINGGQLVEYAKIDHLPGLALKMLYNRGKSDNRNYIKEYLDIDVSVVKASKSVIYSNPGMGATKMYLLKGDVLTVIGEKGEWLKIEYRGKKLVQGWVKKQELE